MHTGHAKCFPGWQKKNTCENACLTYFIWSTLSDADAYCMQKMAAFENAKLQSDLIALLLPPLVSEDQAKFVSNESKPALWKQSDVLSFFTGLYLCHTSSLSLSFSLPARWSWSNESLQQWLYLLNSLRPKISLGVPICSCLCVCIRFFLCNTMLVGSEKQPMRGSSCLCVFAWETDYIPQASLALGQWLTALSEFQSEHFV